MKLQTKIVKQGNGYALRIPTALIRSGVVDINKEYTVEFEEKNSEFLIRPSDLQKCIA